jgi:predicted nucleotidyltransferase
MIETLIKAVGNSNLGWLAARTIFLTRHGSHAYGTNTPTSDEDFKGVAIPTSKYFFGYLERFDQAEFRHQKDGIDAVIYDIRKFFKLAADCNPSIIEVLFTDPDTHVILTAAGRYLLENRDLFISKKAKHTFSGYAVSQLKKIKSHYRWLKNPPQQPPTRDEFGLPERTVIPRDQLLAAQSMIRKQIEHWNVPIDELDDAARIAVQERFVEALATIETGYREQVLARLLAAKSVLFSEAATWRSSGPPWSENAASEECGFDKAVAQIKAMEGASLERVAGNLLGFSDNFLELLDKERLYRTRQEEWRSYQTWLETRNPARSELERKHGYDTKHGMHLVRLIRMGEEILSGKGVIVKRPDREELIGIRNGAWSYETMLGWAEMKLKLLEELYQTSTVPSAPDRKRLDELCQDLAEWGCGGGSGNPFSPISTRTYELLPPNCT